MTSHPIERDVVRAARLDSLSVLLTRIANGLTLTPEEARLLVEHVSTEVSESTTARTAGSDLAHRAEQAEAKALDYENRITWHTTCESCARVLDSCIRETERAELAEAELRRYTEAESADAAAGSYAARAEQAEAALARAREAALWVRRNYPGLTHVNDRLAAAHDEPAPATPAEPDRHVYLSTGCLHGDHAYCQGMTGLNGSKRPGSCKFCAAPCQCFCHQKGQPDPA